MTKTHFNGKEINLSYFQTDTTKIELCKRLLSLSVFGYGEKTIRLEDLNEEEYRTVEETALAYLLKNAIEKSKGRNLVSIIRIKQKITCTPVNDSVELELSLKGVAIYEN